MTIKCFINVIIKGYAIFVQTPQKVIQTNKPKVALIFVLVDLLDCFIRHITILTCIDLVATQVTGFFFSNDL